MENGIRITARECQQCNSTRILEVSAKCRDLCDVRMKGDGSGDWLGDYVPGDAGLGGDQDCVELNLCLDCGHLQGEWPRPLTKLERNGPHQ